MINFSKTTWLTIVLIIMVCVAGFFTYQWWQVKGELVKQIELNKNLTKQVNELKKEIEELKISKETIEEIIEEIKEETTGWKTYRNEKQGFEIRIPSRWDYRISIDKKRNDYYIFAGGFGEENIWLGLAINMFTETTPALPSWPFCYREGEFIVLEKNKLPKYIVSTFREGISEEECDKFLLNEHLVYSQFCIDKELKAYPAKLGRNGEYFFYCETAAPLANLYNFQFFCKGEEWQGKEGKDKCSALFDRILFSFRLIEK